MKKGRLFLNVYYDDNLKRMKNIDGLYFSRSNFDFGETRTDHHPDWNSKKYFTEKRTEEELKILIFPMDLYNYCDLALSDREKKYIAAFEEREREFDRKYAGEIKRKLRKASILRHSSRGKQPTERLEYPRYLIGDELPPGIVTPASYFTASFMFSYIRGLNFIADGNPQKKNSLKTFLHSIGRTRGAYVEDIGECAADGARYRLRSLYPEYILTFYYLKRYKSPEERHRVVTDLATYYSDVAFRGAAERLFKFRRFLSAGQRCRIANYVASRVYDLVMKMERPEEIAKLKQKYRESIAGKCESLIISPSFRKERAGLISEAEGKAERNALWNKLRTGQTRCIND